MPAVNHSLHCVDIFSDYPGGYCDHYSDCLCNLEPFYEHYTGSPPPAPAAVAAATKPFRDQLLSFDTTLTTTITTSCRITNSQDIQRGSLRADNHQLSNEIRYASTSSNRQHGRLVGDCAPVLPTAPYASRSLISATNTASLEIPIGLGADSKEPRLQPTDQTFPVHSEDSYLRRPPTPSGSRAPPPDCSLPQPAHHRSTFRKLASTTANTRTTRRLPAARLWNPTNSTPRETPTLHKRRQRKRQVSNPPEPSIPIYHPELDISTDFKDPSKTGDAAYPLLTLPQILQLKGLDSPSQRNSLQAERRASNDHRVSLPSSVRASYDGKRSGGPTPTPFESADDANEGTREDSNRTLRIDYKGKGKKVTMAAENADNGRSHPVDLERGHNGAGNRQSAASLGDGIGSAISSSNSSIMGEDVQPDETAWGPMHPCYPHMNPHVPIESPEYSSTRIIRIKRDWMIRGDLAPTFSNLYPDILDPAGLTEQEFRRIIEKLNTELVPIFDPTSLRNVVDGVLGVVTGWIWDDMGMTAAKSRLGQLERWIDEWNKEMEKTLTGVAGGSSFLAPKIISLRKTGYMTLDIQIPDPEIAAESNASLSNSGTGQMPMEPSRAAVRV